jgi:hypothetical protein
MLELVNSLLGRLVRKQRMMDSTDEVINRPQTKKMRLYEPHSTEMEVQPEDYQNIPSSNKWVTNNGAGYFGMSPKSSFLWPKTWIFHIYSRFICYLIQRCRPRRTTL